MPSFSIPLSGLRANSEALSAVANNLANMNTVGYKATSTEFSSMLYQSLGTNGAGDPIQLGLGTTVSSNNSKFTPGPSNNTGVATDMAIAGNGFFVLNQNGEQLFTRAGNFTEGSDGALTSASGANVMGYAANTDGTIDMSGGIKGITIPTGQQYPAQATSYINGGLSLDGTSAVVFPSAQTTSHVEMSANFQSGSSTPFTQTETVYDSTGAPQTLTYTFTPSGTADTWNYSITIPGSDVGQSASTDVTVSSGELTFDATSGSLTGVTVDSNTNSTYGSVSGTAGDVTGISVPNLATGGTLTFDWNIFSSTGTSNLNESSSASAVTGIIQDGHAGSLATYSKTVNVYDAQGGSHTVTMNFWKTGTDLWDYTMTVPGADVGQAASTVQISAGTLGFDTGGTLSSVAVTGTTGGKVTPAFSGQTGAGNITGITIPTLADGAGTLTFDWDLFTSSGTTGVGQSSSKATGTSASSSTLQAGDGYISGTLISISVNNDGTIEGKFSNGKSRAVAQLALASFANEDGLSLQGNNCFQETLSSGNANIGVAESSGRGSIQGGYLEGSNVDIATEFSNLIVAQRAYEANAKAVTTFDQISQDTINLKAG